MERQDDGVERKEKFSEPFNRAYYRRAGELQALRPRPRASMQAPSAMLTPLWLAKADLFRINAAPEQARARTYRPAAS